MKTALTNLGAVPITRKINEKPLDEDVTLTPSDIGTASDSHTHAMSDITSGVSPLIMGCTGADKCY